MGTLNTKYRKFYIFNIRLRDLRRDNNLSRVL